MRGWPVCPARASLARCAAACALLWLAGCGAAHPRVPAARVGGPHAPLVPPVRLVDPRFGYALTLPPGWRAASGDGFPVTRSADLRLLPPGGHRRQSMRVVVCPRPRSSPQGPAAAAGPAPGPDWRWTHSMARTPTPSRSACPRDAARSARPGTPCCAPGCGCPDRRAPRGRDPPTGPAHRRQEVAPQTPRARAGLFCPLGGTPRSRGRPQRSRRRGSGRARSRHGGAARRPAGPVGPVALAAPARAPCGRRGTPAMATARGPQAPRRESPPHIRLPAPPSATAGTKPRSGARTRGRAGPRGGAGDGHGAGAGGDAQGIVHPDI